MVTDGHGVRAAWSWMVTDGHGWSRMVEERGGADGARRESGLGDR